MMPYATPRRMIHAQPRPHLRAYSRTNSAPHPYKPIRMKSDVGVKKTDGGAEPESSSPVIGDKIRSVSAGLIRVALLGGLFNWGTHQAVYSSVLTCSEFQPMMTSSRSRAFIMIRT